MHAFGGAIALRSIVTGVSLHFAPEVYSVID